MSGAHQQGAAVSAPAVLVLWALPKGETDRLHERPIAEGSEERLAKIRPLAAADGWHGFRFQWIDGSTPNFAACVGGAK